MNLFTGCYEHAVDGKNRVSVPRKIVETLRELGSPDEVVITVGLDRCLFLYTPGGFSGAGQSIESSPLGEEGTREVQRTFYSSAETCSIDRSGRLLLPQSLKDRAGIADKVVFAGVGRRVELWSPGSWAERQARTQADYEKHARDVFR
jgi:MraZ protein